MYGQLANALADAGFLVLRYDKRGVGQSGGRIETAGFAEYAEDLRAAVKFVADRKDVDPKRIAVVGHSEGGAIALVAAARDKRIAALVLMAAVGVSGSDLVLAQQKRLLDRSNLSDADKQATIDLQKQILEAVITARAWCVAGERAPAKSTTRSSPASSRTTREDLPGRCGSRS